MSIRNSERVNFSLKDRGFTRAVLTGARLRTCDGLQLRGWYDRWTRLVRFRARNKDLESLLEHRTKLPGRPHEKRYSLSEPETYFISHRTGESVILPSALYAAILNPPHIINIVY